MLKPPVSVASNKSPMGVSRRTSDESQSIGKALRSASQELKAAKAKTENRPQNRRTSITSVRHEKIGGGRRKSLNFQIRVAYASSLL